ncbi:rsbT co-antagonist protein RsbR [Prauserella shujinwangii]|uniref:RsbT co-antagonist protein RsbR n=1 Tax=Prauserella shujinwangii TaxID=1453103 RepID=A0A2T0M026_9PSEU|nr:STAS domain-containing protein [Prauserella shujinwangii]PRX49927.1 rsbT co-antagonist protein RsbR [Prauserella shujinwangii]
MTVTAQDVRDELAEFLRERRPDILRAWSEANVLSHVDPADTEQESAELLAGVVQAIRDGAEGDSGHEGFSAARSVLGTVVSGSRDGARPDLAALKPPLLRLWTEHRRSAGPDGLTEHAVDGAVALSTAVDTLRAVLLELEVDAGLETIRAQREQLTELSTPVIKLWDGVLAIPLIGTLDSMRSQAATENLLEQIVAQQARVAILDITGVPAVDTMVAQHLLKTAMAARLMGAECIISGIRPQIAQTMVQLGIDLGEVATRATLADALGYALRTTGMAVVSDQHS